MFRWSGTLSIRCAHRRFRARVRSDPHPSHEPVTSWGRPVGVAVRIYVRGGQISRPNGDVWVFQEGQGT